MNRPDASALLQAADSPGWAERNQQWLAARFMFWRGRLAAGVTAATAPPEGDDGGDFEPAASTLARTFGLSAFETELLVLAAGLEIDASLREAIARAQGHDPSGPVALAYALAQALIAPAHWDALSPSAPLRRWHLVDIDSRAGLMNAGLRLDERVLHFITGVEAVDERLRGVAGFELPGPPQASEAAQAQGIAIAAAVPRRPLVLLTHVAHDAASRRRARELALLALQHLGLRALWVDAAALPTDARELATLARHIDREAALSRAGIVLAPDAEAGAGPAAVHLVAVLGAAVFVLGDLAPLALADLPQRTPLRFAVAAPPAAPVGGWPAVVRQGAARALQQFRVEPALLEQALAGVAGLDDVQAIDTALWASLREAARGGLDTLAQRIDSRASFDDLVVPPFVASQLREIAGQLRHRTQVYDDWGFGARDARGLGISALFAGESGTGKTLAAEVIAHEAGLDLYRVDLAATVSKYIGETEKNLSRLFDAAERSGAVLLFDEADALFGQRSEVRDSHDRYANIEVAYLLQRIESYRGLAILTTNMRAALDRAFLRRIRFVVQFPFPDAAMRAQIWQRALPGAAPTRALDFAQLGRLNVTGGSIRNIAMNAAFIAAGRGGPIDAGCIAAAAQAEFAKLERGHGDAALGALR